MVKEISPPEAWEILKSDSKAVLLDVRSRVEFEFVGHPINAIHVPWQEAPDWQVDPDFVNKVRNTLSEVTEDRPEGLPIFALCRSGARSMAAAQVLAEQGFANVTNVAEGFEGDKDADKHRGNINGWRFHGLPWEQS